MFKTALFAAAAALATIATASPVLAKDVTVRFGDLDLATAKGQRTFARRVDHAARDACDLQADGRIASHGAMRCYRQARTKAHTEMAAAVENHRLGG